jgi:hypothetical protein
MKWDDRKFHNFVTAVGNINLLKAEDTMFELADDIVSLMCNIIHTSRKRPDKGTHLLENSIDWEGLIDDPEKQVMIGIANIDKMTKEAPYWEVLDQGGYVPVPNIGYFTSGSGLSGDRTTPNAGSSGQTWVHTGKERRSYLMKPSKAIEGIDYIGYSLRQLDVKFKSMVEQFGMRIFENVEKV